MKTVAILDTSILLELLKVPGRHQGDEVARQLRQRKQDLQESLLLPLGSIIEAGNHIARLADGRERRTCAKRFVELVRLALKNQAPFSVVGREPELLAQWCDDFVEWVTPEAREFTDLTIKKVWDRQCALHQARRVYVWSLDSHLSSFARPPVV